MKEVVKISLNKKGISIMIGYIILITGAVVMSAIVYQWMKTYVPKESIDCPDGVSVFIVNSTCTQDQSDDYYDLDLTLKNNGRFDVGGYFIHATTLDTPGTLATLDLSGNLTVGGIVSVNAITFADFSEYQNALKPGANRGGTFKDISNKIYSVEIIPLRFQIEENKYRLVSCSNAKIIEKINCRTIECTDTDLTQCGVGEICVDNQCTLCGNGVWVTDGEECDDGNVVSGDGCSNICGRETNWNCLGEPSTCNFVG